MKLPLLLTTQFQTLLKGSFYKQYCYLLEMHRSIRGKRGGKI